MASVSYFLGVDAMDTKPNMLLAGDAFLGPDDGRVYLYVTLVPGYTGVWEIAQWNNVYSHQGYGNAALGDGSAHRLTTKQLKDLLSSSGDPRNMLVLPWN